VTGGTVTGLKVFSGDELLLEATGYSIDVLALVDAVAGAKSADGDPFLQMIFGAPMTVTGSVDSDNPIWGGLAADIITGGGGNDRLYGDIDSAPNGHDQLFGGAGDDVLFGYLGNDLLDGGAGADQMDGGPGSDTYVVDNVDDEVIELVDAGIDTVRSFVDFALPDHVENLELVGAAATTAAGNPLANVITGNNAANRLDGSAGNDRLLGGKGKDVLTGGVDADQFVFGVKAKKKDADIVTDFNVAEDALVLDNSAFKALKGKVLKGGDYFHVGKKAAGKKDFVIYNEGTGKLSYDGDGKGGVKAKLIAKLDSGLDLSAGDILVV
jgi:Ca2+-binding RTX toxin-like protein